MSRYWELRISSCVLFWILSFAWCILEVLTQNASFLDELRLWDTAFPYSFLACSHSHGLFLLIVDFGIWIISLVTKCRLQDQNQLFCWFTTDHSVQPRDNRTNINQNQPKKISNTLGKHIRRIPCIPQPREPLIHLLARLLCWCPLHVHLLAHILHRLSDLATTTHIHLRTLFKQID